MSPETKSGQTIFEIVFDRERRPVTYSQESTLPSRLGFSADDASSLEDFVRRLGFFDQQEGLLHLSGPSGELQACRYEGNAVVADQLEKIVIQGKPLAKGYYSIVIQDSRHPLLEMQDSLTTSGIATALHNLKSPGITTEGRARRITELTDKLLKTLKDDEQHQLASNVRHQAECLAATTYDLEQKLDGLHLFTDLGIWTLEVQYQPFKMLADGFDPVISALQPRIREKGINVMYSKSLCKEKEIVTHGFTVKNGMFVLVDNAVKYAPHGAYLSFGYDIANIHDHPFHRAIVHNSGSKIPEDQIPNLFKQFKPLPNGNSDGWHIGLPCVQKEVQKIRVNDTIKGFVEVKNTGDGVDGILYLPFVDPTE